jgi:dihydrofolate synthase/folylpolyglutamate synthase
LAERIHLCPVDTPRAVSASDLAAELPENAPKHATFDTFQAALDASLKHANPILIAGSLYLVGEAKSWLEGRSFQSCTQ